MQIFSRFTIPGLVIFMLAACSTKNVKNERLANPVIFPAPPDTTRIQFLKSISSSADIDQKRSAFWSYVLGEPEDKPILKPYGIASSKGKIYICDTMLPGLEIIDLEEGRFEYFTPGGLGQLKKPINCTIDNRDRLYVADTERGQVVVFDSRLNYMFAIGDGKNIKPTDVAVENGKLYICDLAGHRVLIIDTQTKREVNAFPDLPQSAPGYLFSPTNLHVSDNKIYISDTGDACVKVYDTTGKYLKNIGSYGRNAGQFVRPKGVAVDHNNVLYVVDAGFENVQLFNPRGQLLMPFGGTYKGAGYMWLPAKVALDYQNLSYFNNLVYDGFDLQYLILVSNQYGPDRINIYGFVEPKRK